MCHQCFASLEFRHLKWPTFLSHCLHLNLTHHLYPSSSWLAFNHLLSNVHLSSISYFQFEFHQHLLHIRLSFFLSNRCQGSCLKATRELLPVYHFAFPGRHKHYLVAWVSKVSYMFWWVMCLPVNGNLMNMYYMYN